MKDIPAVTVIVDGGWSKLLSNIPTASPGLG